MISSSSCNFLTEDSSFAILFPGHFVSQISFLSCSKWWAGSFPPHTSDCMLAKSDNIAGSFSNETSLLNELLNKESYSNLADDNFNEKSASKRSHSFTSDSIF